MSEDRLREQRARLTRSLYAQLFENVWTESEDRLVPSLFFFFQAEDGIRDFHVTGVQTCALPIFCRVELQVRRDGSVLAVIDVQGHPDAVARDVFDLDIRHHDVDGPVSNEVPEHEVHDPFLRDGVEFDAELAEDAIDHAPKVVLLLGPLRAFEKLQVADEDLLEDVEELRFLFDELRLDRLVEVLVRHRVVQDPDVRVVLQDRLDFNLVHVLLDDLRDRGDLPEGRLHDAADLRGLHLDAPIAEQAAEVPLLDRVEGAEDGGLAVLLEVVEHLLRLAALPVEVRNAACGGGLPSSQA